MIFPPLAEDADSRSIWREMKFIALVIRTNILSIREVIENFADVSRMLFVEKRRKPERDLQLTGLC